MKSRSEDVWIAELLSQDVDDVVRAVEHLTTGNKLAQVRTVAAVVPSLENELARLKALSFIQAALGSLSTRAVPVGTANTIIDAAAPLTNAKAHPWDVRRAAYHVSALVFLRVRSLTPKLDSEIRAAFKAAKRDPDANIRDFVRHAERAVLSQREAAPTKAFDTPVRDASGPGAMRTVALGAYRAVGRAAKRLSGSRRADRSHSRPRSTS